MLSTCDPNKHYTTTKTRHRGFVFKFVNVVRLVGI